MANRLARESSPYLRQHARNPVDWYPWSEEAFALAKREDRPVFLSVGYSTCHWCHVMEHESFESRAVADALNAHFVPIKVDREERPDVDRVYMLFVQATTGAGGWPMSVWLTPDLEPFFGGTYFPPTSRWGRPGFLDVLVEIARVWRQDRDRIVRTASSLAGQLRAVTAGGAAGPASGPVAPGDALRAGADALRSTFDRRFGGFGGAPKFPRPSELFLLLREHVRTGEQDLLDMVLDTLRAMSLGGMRDHVGGGFHRYAVDAAWRVPHFEKMLYDQAQIVLALIEASQASGDAFWGTVAEDTLAYVRREMTHPEGGFYSAEDADSVPPEQAAQADARPSEGAYYLWSAEEIDRLLGDGAEVVKLRFGVEPGGNAPHDPQGEFGTKNILYMARSIEDVAGRTGRDPDEVVRLLQRARVAMAEARRARPRPHLDDKVLTAWNGLMMAAFARASRVLGHRPDDPARRVGAECLESARRAAAFIRRRLWDADRGRLLRRSRDGVAGIDAYCEDYACLVWGLLELFQADGDSEWLEWAIQVQDVQNALFWDPAEGGWFSTTGQDPAILLRLKEDHDGAEPAASSVSVSNELLLAHLVGGSDRTHRAARTLGRLGPHPGELARSMPMMMSALALWHGGGQQIVIVGSRDDEATRALHDVVASRYLPFAVVVPVAPGDAQARLAQVLPFVGSLPMRASRPTAYVCRNFACLEPVTTPEALEATLGS